MAILYDICKKADKPIFGTGGAMQFLVYYWATDMLQCEVINGEEKGSDISTISQYNDATRAVMYGIEQSAVAGSVINFNPKAKLNDELFPEKGNCVFLDHSNGDYYCLKLASWNIAMGNVDSARSNQNGKLLSNILELEEWVPMGNFGLHNYYFTNDSKYCSQVKKVKAYKPQKHHIESQNLPVITSKLWDVKCELITKNLSHYLLKDLPFEFLVNWDNTWDPHAVKATSVTGSNGKYLELAESDRGPQVSIHGNAAMVQFYISHHQPETVSLLNNFITHFVHKVRIWFEIIDLQQRKSWFESGWG